MAQRVMTTGGYPVKLPDADEIASDITGDVMSREISINQLTGMSSAVSDVIHAKSPKDIRDAAGIQESQIAVKGDTGPTGPSAYEQAVSDGLFEGTFEDFLSSLKGDKGDQGDAGETGPQGAPGAPGAPGDQGLQGEKGEAGAQGMKGDVGEKGEKGDTGPAGPAGEKGLKGDTGLTGASGQKGDKGDAGIQGPKGDTGLTGPAGPKGDSGAKGEAGAIGPQGPKGDAGVKGDTGAQGVKGDTGAMGPKGDTGPQGPQGVPGANATPTLFETVESKVVTAGTKVAIKFTKAFTAPPIVQPSPIWNGTQMIIGQASEITTSGCNVTVMQSRGTLLLTTGPFENAAANAAFRMFVIGN
ncbi:hypothetical protein [Pantoea agglomerans]|uniref:hypothetical protein n=1 Tax=Enterobacter agglomerans TaxID=549 RepID=UPI003207E5AD